MCAHVHMHCTHMAMVGKYIVPPSVDTNNYKVDSSVHTSACVCTRVRALHTHGDVLNEYGILKNPKFDICHFSVAQAVPKIHT